MTGREESRMDDKKQKCVVIFSGGQDSTTCLALALREFGEVEAITFRYGQRHIVEEDAARAICEMWSVKQTIVDLDFVSQIGNSALVGDGDVNSAHPSHPNLPSSFVPNRNAFFISIAHAYAQKIGAKRIMGGMCETDYSGYPDCRETFIGRIVGALNAGSDSEIVMETPLMYLTKAMTWKVADNLGVLATVRDISHTCYEGNTVMHEWGAGCGDCPACKLRAKGWNEFVASRGAE